MIPDFRDDGYLPNGLHLATEQEVISRFGTTSGSRRRLAQRLLRWFEIARYVRAKRFFVDGSFVTAKAALEDVDAVIWLPNDFRDQVFRGVFPAIELEHALLTRQPEEIFAAEDRRDWDDWVQFFSRTREPDGRRKGLVEIEL
jgi:hypothetical protein